MRLKLNENLPHDLAAELGRRGHDVHTVAEGHLAGESDPDSILTLIGRLMRTHSLDELRGCVVVVEPQKARIR